MPTQLEATPQLTYAQKGRAISVETTLGPDVLLLESVEGEEEMSGGFHYTLGLLAKDPGIDATKLIRTPATVKLTLSDGSERVINGLISKFVQLEQVEGLTVYEAELRPWFWFLSLSTDFRTFQNMSIPDIVKAVCKDQGFSDVTSRCIKPHNPHEYRVQYGETHLDFISRLMEEEGIFWFGEHDGKKCNLILADANGVAKQVVKLRMSTVAHETEDEFVLQEFTLRQEVRPGQYTTIDYNFETPSTQLLSNASGNHASEVVEFPGGFGKRDDGDRLARLRQQEILAEAIEAEGSGRCRAIKLGARIELSKHPNKNANNAYLITSLKQSAKLGDFRTGGEPGVAYSSSFTATPYDVPYRPARRTPLPRAYGYESAVVVGPAGDEIYTDKYGRVKVQFFWDRKGTKDDKSSCWVRVSTVWAGKGWGVIHTPRIGQEVLVAYINGDPEDPIIVGRVYNAEQMPPYALPANKTQSGVKTRSTLQGTPDNFNEIRFEDKKGSEELYIHAEKDKKIVVEHDRSIDVGDNDTEKVAKDQSVTVGENRKESVGGNESITIGKNRSENVGGTESITIVKTRTESVGEDETVNIGKKRSHTIGDDESLSVSGKRSASVAKDESITVGESRTVSTAKNEKWDVGKTLLINVADEITIKTGDAMIIMKKNGEVKIKGSDITVEGSGKINVKASSDLVLKGSKIAAN